MQRYAPLYARLKEAPDVAAAISALEDDEVVGALAWATRERNQALADALSTEALERTHRRAETLEALRLYRLLVSSVVDYAIFALDVEGHVVTWNAGAERLKGYAPAEILGKPLSTFYTPEDNARRHSERLMREAADKGHVEEEGWRVRKDGTRFWARITLTALRADDGSLRGFAKVTRDLTERRNAEEALRAANTSLEQRVVERTRELEDAVKRLRAANESLEAFSFVVSHDLKEPVRALHLMLDALCEDERGRLSPEGRDMLDHSMTSVRRLGGLVNDLLEWSRAGRPAEEAGAHRVPLVAAFAADATQLRFEAPARERGATFDVRLRADHAARVSPSALSLILGNLVLNAIRHNPRPNPLVRIHSDIREAPPEGRQEVVIVVEDNGPGFSDEILHAAEAGIVVPPAKPSTSGFGLAIVRRAVERYGGSIHLGSSEEGGAAVTVVLPAA